MLIGAAFCAAGGAMQATYASLIPYIEDSSRETAKMTSESMSNIPWMVGFGFFGFGAYFLVLSIVIDVLKLDDSKDGKDK